MSDPLSDVLRAVRLTGGVFLDVRLSAPYSVISELTARDCRSILENPVQLIFFHVVLTGRLLLQIADEAPFAIEGGEIVLLTQNDVHILSSAPGLAPVHASSLVQISQNGGLARVVHGGSGEQAHMVCGFLGSAESVNPVFRMLPRVLRLDLRHAASRDWIESSVRFAVSELAEGRLASSEVMSRLSEVLLVEAVRHYATTLAADDTAWLRGFTDPHVAQALALIHRQIETEWTTGKLARAVGMSRSALADRFTSLIGVPPIRYQTHWRLQVACQQLRESGRAIGQIAHAVGYESEEAFSRAFKRILGTTPSRWRSGTSSAA